MSGGLTMVGAGGSASLLLGAACALAGCAGFFGWMAWQARRRALRMRRSVRQAAGCDLALRGMKRDGVIDAMERLSEELCHQQVRALCPKRLAASPWYASNAVHAGVSESISEAAFCEARFRIAVLGAVMGCILGSVLSGEFACLLAGVGGAVGWRLPAAALRRRQQERVHDMEAHLPEMLDVMALGMRSGLSFDAALRLYRSHFETPLARELGRAQDAWEAGLETRERALESVASAYGSAALRRAADAWTRSLRFGTSMVEGLEAEAVQARAVYRSKREELIAKAPVKMMVPTGVLILPAMLVLVLGPVLLELMNGGF